MYSIRIQTDHESVPAGAVTGKAKINDKPERKLLPVLAAVSLMLAGLSGCGGHAEPPLEAAAYSNLTDAVSRGLLSESLADSGISENRVSILLDRVDQFNASVKNEWLTEGFESGALTDTKYDPYEMQELWTEKNGSFPGYNCRITAFSLFGAFVTAGADQPETQGEDALFFGSRNAGRRSCRSLRKQHIKILCVVCAGGCCGQHGDGGTGQGPSGRLGGARRCL